MNAAAFTSGPEGELIGYSVWPWDDLYRPVVGLFVSGRMISHAFCELLRPRFMPEVSRTLLARGRRKLTGVRITPQPIALDGPELAIWFRMVAAPEIVARIGARDPTVRLARLEDGEPVAWTHAQAPAAGATPGGPMTVEALLELKSAAPPPAPLNGFPLFSNIPFSHQLDITFVELLRRLPDPAARAGYLPELQSGAVSLFDLRRMIMESEEFRARRIGVQDRIGTLYTSPVWRELAHWPTIEQATRPTTRFALHAHTGLTDEAFIAMAYKAFLDRTPDEGGMRHYLELTRTSGRREVAVELARWATLRGEGVEIV